MFTIDVLGGICAIFWTYWYNKGILAPLTSRIKRELKAESRLSLVSCLENSQQNSIMLAIAKGATRESRNFKLLDAGFY